MLLVLVFGYLLCLFLAVSYNQCAPIDPGECTGLCVLREAVASLLYGSGGGQHQALLLTELSAYPQTSVVNRDC